MKIPPELIGQLITILMVAKVRGWIDIRSLEPLLRIVVDSGNGERTRQSLAEIIVLLEDIEKAQPR